MLEIPPTLDPSSDSDEHIANHSDTAPTRKGWAIRPSANSDAPSTELTQRVAVEPLSDLGRSNRVPQPGDALFGFQLDVELGRGAFGSVYLASQPELAGRKVVLKISSNLSVESRTLARLQHTNIVPVYSVHREGDVQAVCMPYYGAVTLAELLRRLRGRANLPQSGWDFVNTFREATTGTPARFETPFIVPSQVTAADEVILEKLASGSYISAVCWLMARLADGLHHAHERGILHRDIKPANILLTDEGQPMLLDFGVAEEYAQRRTSSSIRIGGTVPYMAPEQLLEHRDGTAQANFSSDVYALGLVFCELLTRKYPYQYPSSTEGIDAETILANRRDDRPNLRKWNPDISPGLQSIIHTCLAFDSRYRYRTAGEFRDDLERYLADRPMLVAPEPSRAERVRKWLKRNHWVRSNLTMAIVASILLALGTWGYVRRSDRLAKLEAASAREQLTNHINHAHRMLYVGGSNDRSQVESALASVTESLTQYGIPNDPNWSSRPMMRALSVADREEVRHQLADASLLAARANRLKYLLDANDQKSLQEAIRLNELAEQIAPGYGAKSLYRQREYLMNLAEKPQEASQAAQKAKHVELKTARDFFIAAEDQIVLAQEIKTGPNRDELKAPYLNEAIRLYAESLRLDPKLFWAHFGQGYAYMELQRFHDARGAYNAAIAIDPKSVVAFHARGVASYRLKDFESAYADLSHVIALQPDYGQAYHDRAVTLIDMNEWEVAQSDLNRAVEFGVPFTAIQKDRARVRRELKIDQNDDKLDPDTADGWILRGLDTLGTDLAQSLKSFEKAIETDPKHATSYIYAAHVLEQLKRPADAKAKLDRAIELNPAEFRAWAGRGLMNARLKLADQAIRDAQAALERNVSPALMFQVACIYSLVSVDRPEYKAEAVTYLGIALRGGAGVKQFETASDLATLREMPEFQKLVRDMKTRKTGP